MSDDEEIIDNLQDEIATLDVELVELRLQVEKLDYEAHVVQKALAAVSKMLKESEAAVPASVPASYVPLPHC